MQSKLVTKFNSSVKKEQQTFLITRRSAKVVNFVIDLDNRKIENCKKFSKERKLGNYIESENSTSISEVS